jgi:SAM-dependent methyltransferase
MTIPPGRRPARSDAASLLPAPRTGPELLRNRPGQEPRSSPARRLRWLVHGVLNKVRSFGPITTAKIAWYELLYHFRFPASMFQLLAARRRESGSLRPYAQTPYFFLRRVFRELPIEPGRTVFVDIGSGLGRVLLFASQFPFQRLIGVECSADSCALARANLQRHYQSAGKTAPPWEIVHAYVERDVAPAGTTIFYLYDPFEIATLRTVAGHLADFASRQRQPVFVIWVGSVPKEQAFSGHGFRPVRTERFGADIGLTVFAADPEHRTGDPAAAPPAGAKPGPRA